jgi:hypothetical protein
VNVRTDDQYSEQEAQRRTEAALRATFSTPPKPQSEMKLGKRKAKTKKSPGRKKKASATPSAPPQRRPSKPKPYW